MRWRFRKFKKKAYFANKQKKPAKETLSLHLHGREDRGIYEFEVFHKVTAIFNSKQRKDAAVYREL